MSLLLAGLASGCRSPNSFFQLDSDSRMPWLGLNIPLGQQNAKPKSVETVSQADEEAAKIVTAQEKSAAAPEKSPGFFSRLLGSEQSIPLPDKIPASENDRVVILEGPRETFQ